MITSGIYPVVILLSGLLVVATLRGRKRRADLPPGPPSSPLIGHSLIMPALEDNVAKFDQWSRTYGDVMHLSVLGKDMIVLSSDQAATDLLDKRSAIYSDRPTFPMFEKVGLTDLLGFLPYGPKFFEHRKLLQQPFTKNEIPAYNQIIDEEVNLLLEHIMKQKDSVERSVHRYTTSIILRITYGHRAKTCDDTHFHLTENIERLMRECSRPSLLDISPIFANLPSWFPGAWFIKFIRDRKPVVKEYIDYPFRKVEQEMALGTAKPSVVSLFLENMSKEPENTSDQYETMKWVSNQMLGGGSETAWHTVMVFVACMLMNPDVMVTAQEEIDRVVGRSRMPDLNDKDLLPYIDCIVKETMRWNPVVPMGVPHRCMEDDWYKGMLIPKGAVMLTNTKGITRDIKNHCEPEKFWPGRFIPRPTGGGEAFCVGAAFGWGRRICPGRLLAENVVWLVVARMISVFNITRPKQADGKPLELEIKYTSAFFSHPESFPCDIHPRDARAAALIQEANIHEGL